MLWLVGRLILGGLCAIAVLAALDRLVAWRRGEAGKDDAQRPNDGDGGRTPAVPFVGGVAGLIVVTILLAHALFGVLSSFGGLTGFLIGAAIVAAVRRKRLPLIQRTVVEAIREIIATHPMTTPADPAPPGRVKLPRRARKGSVPTSSVDVQVKQAAKRAAKGRSAQASPWVASVPPKTGARPRDERAIPSDAGAVVNLVPKVEASPRDERALADARRELVGHLKARAAALAAAAPIAKGATTPAVEVAVSDLASQASAEIAAARAQHEVWQAEAAAQREAWRRDGEAQRQQWREQSQALQKVWSRPGEQRQPDGTSKPA